VNSGTLVDSDYLRSLGGYDERFSLYFTDNWFSRRFSKSGKQFAITGAKITHDLAIDSCQDKGKVLWIYAQSIMGTRRLYADDPIVFTVLFLFGFLGALKRAWIHRDLRFIRVFFRPVIGLS
jgi:GT2 family glycosyltransferase